VDDFMPLPKPYFVRDASELGALRATVLADEKEKLSPAWQALPWPERTRREAEMRDRVRELGAAERQALAATRPAPVQPPRASALPQRPTANAAPQYMEPVAYFDEPGHVAPMVGNAGPVKWPSDFVARTELLTAAVAEVKRLGLLNKPAS